MKPAAEESVASQPTGLDDRSYDRERTQRKRAAVLAGVGRIAFQPEALRVVPEWPVIYWWDASWLNRYRNAAKVESACPARATQGLYDNVRFTRSWHELAVCRIDLVPSRERPSPWVPFVNGMNGATWIEPLRLCVSWGAHGMEPKVVMGQRTKSEVYQYANEHHFFTKGGVAFAMIGSAFGARLCRYSGTFGDKGRSVFPGSSAAVLCLLNSRVTRTTMEALNPSISFQAGDVNRLPLFPIANADDIFATVEAAFTLHESHREPSVEFKSPGPSPWRHAQAWAQLAVDRPEGAPLPDYVEVLDPEPATDHLSFALGVALGRFGPRGEGVLDPATANLSRALPNGILFLDGTLNPADRADGLGAPAALPLHAAWHAHCAAIAPGAALRDYLRTDFFSAIHRQMYDNRPIHWPLSSKKKTFVAWVTIHRWTADTLRHLLADHLYPTQVRLTGELTDLRATRDGADKTAAKNAEKRLGKVKPALDELSEFIAAVEQCAERGPLDGNREQDARYAPDLDDGVMINSAALHPLLSPQWKDPAKWWAELSKPTDKKHYDWAHLAMRYWPTRVDARCKDDPSLGVAHGCFWAYHPARAWAWELRLQDEIGPEFRIAEAPYRGDGGDPTHRAAYLRDQALPALAAVETEALRRRRKKKAPQAELSLLEAGLWTSQPRAAWNLELSIIDKQGADFHLRAPDEPAARAALLKAHPGLADQRRDRLEAAQVKLRYAAPEPEDEADGVDTEEES